MSLDAGVPTTTRPFTIHWGPVIAGALAAAALATVLHSFAAALGLGVSSTAPTWRDASIGLFILSGVYLVLVALASYGLGGYIAGSTRAKGEVLPPEQADIRDGTHGLLVWAIATLLTALLVIVGALGLTRLAAPSAGNAGPAASVGGENIIAYDLDKLFRADQRPPQSGDVTARRAEAARILLTASSHSGVQPDDRAYLARLVSAQTGLAGPDAEKRVDGVIASARDNIRRARRAAVILAFMAGAAALLGAVAAWFAACAGGRHRDEDWRTSIWMPRTRP